MKIDAKPYYILSGGPFSAVVSTVVVFATLFTVTPGNTTQSPTNPFSYVTLAMGADPNVHAPLASFRMHLRAPNYSDDIIVNVRKNISKSVVKQAGVTSYRYQVGNVMYNQVDDGTWLKADLGQANSTQRTSSVLLPYHANGQRAQHFPDRVINGTRMTVSTIQVPQAAFDVNSLSGKTITLTCLSEKRTGWLSSCGAGKLQMTFDHFNDPSNGFVVPKVALRARELPF